MLQLLDPANYSLNIYAVPMFAVGLCCSGLGSFVLIYERVSRLGIAFFLVCLSIGVYLICTGIDLISISDRVAMIWSKVGHMGIAFAPLSILLFAAVRFGLSQRYRIAIRLVITLSLMIVLGMIFTDLYFRDVKQFFWGRWAQFGPLGYIFMLLFFIVMVFISYLFWREYRKSTDELSKKRYGGILAAFGVAYIGSVDMLPALGLEVYPFGYIPIFLGCIIFAYVILRYRLVDITPELAANEILENMQEGVIVTDAEGIIRVVNSTACKMIGRQVRDLSGSSLASFMVIPKAVESATRSGERSSGHEVVLTTGADARMTVSLSVSPLRYKITGEPIGFVYAAHDVTERKKAEEALRESEEKYRLVVENASDAILVAQDGMMKFVNPKAVEYFGHPHEILTTRPFIEFIHPEDRGMVLDRHVRRIRGEELPSVYAFRILARDGTIKWVEIHAIVITWEGKSATLNFLRDITERKWMEEKLRESEKRFKDLYHESPIPTFTWQNKGNDFILVDFNQAAVKLSDGKISDFVGSSALELYKDRPYIFEDMHFCFRERSSVTRELTSRDFAPGRFLLVHYGFIPPDLIIVHIYDQTERKRVQAELSEINRLLTEEIIERKTIEDELRRSEASYRRIINTANEGILILDADFSIRSVNVRMQKMTGFEEKELIGKKVAHLIFPEDIPNHNEKIRERSEGKADTYERRIRRKDGNELWVIISATPILDKENQFQGVFSMFTNISELKRVESQLKHAYLVLQETSEQLIQSDKLAAMGTLAAGVAHEVLNPLNIITVGIAALKTTQDLPLPVREAFDVFQRQADRVVSISRDLQRFARKSVKEMQMTDLRWLMQDTLVLCDPRLKLEGVHVAMDYDNSIPNISVDRSQIRQVFMNIINNAMDAMEEKDNKELLIKIEKLCDSGDKASHLLVTFSDRGCGIQPEVINHLFDPFFTTKDAGKGTGLGLSISHGIIENHAGRIWAENNSQGGASFYIELPLLAMTSADTS